MLKNEKGFSLVELLAIIFISSVVIWPLITTLVGNIEVNDRLQNRRSAVGIADSVLYGLDKMIYTNNVNGLYDLVDDANTALDYFYELNSTTCDTITLADQPLCIQLFSGTFNNLTLDNTQLRVFLYDYNLSDAMRDSILAEDDATIPSEVKTEIGTLVAAGGTYVADFELLRIVVWIQYTDDSQGMITVNGVVFND